MVMKNNEKRRTIHLPLFVSIEVLKITLFLYVWKKISILKLNFDSFDKT